MEWLSELVKSYSQIFGTEGSILLAAVLATTGWIYTAGRQRTLAKRQLSFNTLQTISLDPTLTKAGRRISKELRKHGFPESWDVAIADAADKQEKKRLRQLQSDLRTILNSYEGMAASIRRGDFEEYMFKDVERGSFVRTFEAAEATIDRTRQSRANKKIYEHMEWLYDRWTTNPPGPFRALVERLRGKPFYDQIAYFWFAGISGFVVLSIVMRLLF